MKGKAPLNIIKTCITFQLLSEILDSDVPCGDLEKPEVITENIFLKTVTT